MVIIVCRFVVDVPNDFFSFLSFFKRKKITNFTIPINISGSNGGFSWRYLNAWLLTWFTFNTSLYWCLLFPSFFVSFFYLSRLLDFQFVDFLFLFHRFMSPYAVCIGWMNEYSLCVCQYYIEWSEKESNNKKYAHSHMHSLTHSMLPRLLLFADLCNSDRKGAIDRNHTMCRISPFY